MAGPVAVIDSRGAVPGRPYVRALDGLRGLAVLAVVAYHLDVPVAKGGYLGVDLFFVLSGYLITGLLVHEHRHADRIDVAAFWGRRARRLLPALLAVIAVLLVWAAVWADPVARTRFRGDGLAGLLYVANWRFIADDASYFDRFAAENPLTHLWSLAIEEQFYVVWPLVVAAALSASRRWGVRVLAGVCVVGAVASAIAMAVLFDPADSSRAYYGTDSHGFGLLLGGATALVPARLRPRRPVAASGTIGLAVVIGFMISLSDSGAVAYRGGIVLACVAAAAVILAASVPGLVRSVFSTRPLVAVGRVSYGLYLWHWPVIAILDAERVGVDGTALQLVRVGITVALTVLSYAVIEQPVRLRRFPSRQGHALPIGALVVAVIAGGVVAVSAPQRVFQAPVVVSAAQPDGQAVESAPAVDRDTILFVGDSTAASLLVSLPDVAAARGVDVIPAAVVPGGTATFCPLDLSTPEVEVSPGVVSTEPIDQACDWSGYWPALLGELEPELVVVMFWVWDASSRRVDDEWLVPGSPAWHDHMVAQVRCAVMVLSSTGARVAIAAVPNSVNVAPEGVIALNRAYYEAALRSDGRVSFVDVRDAVEANPEWRWDETHFTGAGGRALSDPLLDEFEQVLERGPVEPAEPPDWCPDRRGVAGSS